MRFGGRWLPLRLLPGQKRVNAEHRRAQLAADGPESQPCFLSALTSSVHLCVDFGRPSCPSLQPFSLPPEFSTICYRNRKFSHTKSLPAGSIGVMKCKVCLQSKHYLLLALLLFFAAVILASKGSKIGQLSHASSNPQDFFVWATNSSFSYSFRYDPRAADEWLFHSGAWLFATSLPPGTVTTTYWSIRIPAKDFHTQQK